jgi:outer membrane protein OmpA-like peptidoglycan-associated protein
MNTHRIVYRRAGQAAGTIVLAWLIAGCAAPTATQESAALPLDEAIAVAADGLAAQTQKLPGFLAKMEAKLVKHTVVIDPVLDAASGQQTGATKLIEQRVSERLAGKRFETLGFQQGNLAKAQYVLAGTMTRIANLPSSRAVFGINLALVDLKSGNVVAQASVRARDDGLDTQPTPYYRDSPVLVKDKVIDGYVRTAQTAPGQPADRFYFERIATASLINEATEAYNRDRYPEALGLYRNALAAPAGEQLRVLNGIYLANWKLGKMTEAEQAFGRVVALGIANSNLGVKFLFNPGSTDFWSDAKVSGPYNIWLRQIAREAGNAKVCMNIVGHTSRTGPDQINDRLSQQRAAYIKQRLEAESAALAARTTAQGVGFRENIVGTGTDDGRDALDRRVEFRITGC